jgi:hypothetical protein
MSSTFRALVLSYFDLRTNVASRLEDYLTIHDEKMKLERDIAAIAHLSMEKYVRENVEAVHRHEWQQRERRYKEEIEVLQRELEHSNSSPSFTTSENNSGTGTQTGLPPRNFSAVDLPRVNQNIGPSYDASGPSSPISLSSDTEYTPKRKLITCISCWERELKCDGSKPKCSRCTRLGHTCIYIEIHGKSGRTRGYVEPQEERLG